MMVRKAFDDSAGNIYHKQGFETILMTLRTTFARNEGSKRMR